MVTILMMSAKIPTLDLLKIKLFWNKGCGVIIFVHDVTNKILSRDSNYIVYVVMWPKFGNSRISTREVIFNFIRIWPEKTVFERWSWFKLSNLGLALRMTSKFHTSVVKGLKLGVGKFWKLIRTFVEVTGEQPVGGRGFPPSWIGLTYDTKKYGNINISIW